jgi:hypothetical protein
MNPYLALLIAVLIAIGLLTAIVVTAALLVTSRRKKVVSISSKHPANQEEPDIAGMVVYRLNPSSRRWAGR